MTYGGLNYEQMSLLQRNVFTDRAKKEREVKMNLILIREATKTLCEFQERSRRRRSRYIEKNVFVIQSGSGEISFETLLLFLVY